MNVMNYITDKIKHEKIHMGLIDPDEQTPCEAAKIAKMLEDAGSDAVMVGGSTGVVKENVDETVKAIKEVVDIPVILFPTHAGAISQHADAIYFMSMLNSKDIGKIIGEQRKGAPIIKMIGIEPIGMAYIIVEPGMTVGKVGKADPIPRDQPQLAVDYALAAKYFGIGLIYLEAGSGAPEPVPVNMIKAVKEETGLPLIIGGGIRTAEQAAAIAEAGADIIVTGTVIEKAKGLKNTLEGLISAIKG